MAMREMQINRGLFQIAMSEQHLDGAQIGAGFEQVRGKAMPQSVRMDVLMLKPGALCGILAGPPEYLGVDGAA